MRNKVNGLICIMLSLLLTGAVFAGDIVGTVTDAGSGQTLSGANVAVEGTALGDASDMSGEYEITKVPAGEVTIKVTYMGYKTASQKVTVSGGKVIVDFALDQDVILGEGVAVMADRAVDRETPVAFSDIKKADMEARLGSQDIPMVLNITPSVYATQGGGGAGDARINVRGFDQRNVAIMINGVPVNDMENGWVYWSNWDGVGDATSSIQMQRGLTAVNLATPAIGGAMNIITEPTSTRKGVTFKQEMGSGAFLKSTLSFGSGLLMDKFAINGTLVKKTGDGVIDKTWTDAYAYYVGASWAINKSNRLEVYAIGAPQRHGQNLYKQNIAVYDQDFAKDMETKKGDVTTKDYSQAALEQFYESDRGRKYNENWNTVSSSYKGKQYWNGSERDRYDSNFINERENYYHKPIVNLNWYSDLTEDLNLFTTAYYSGGTGGGSGTYGDFLWDYGSEPTRIADWDGNIAINRGTETRKGAEKVAGQSMGILRNSVNEQWTIGAISKARYTPTDALTINAGVDWRTAEIGHWREVRDLLGGSYYIDTYNDFDTEASQKKGLGDKINYHNTNTVDWMGGFLQGEYSAGQLTTYGTVGYSMIKYSFTDHFAKTDAGDELFTETDWINGYQAKGGASFRMSETVSIFGNLGYVSKVPIFDAVIDDGDGSKAEDPKNETFLNFEAGINYITPQTIVKLSGYHTIWNDRTKTRGYTNAEGRDVLVFLTGLDAIHKGIELEAGWRAHQMLNLSAVAGFGNWEYTDNVSGQVKDYDNDTFEEYNYYVNNLKVGDQPQTILGLGFVIYPLKGLELLGNVNYYTDHYAAFDPFSRTDAEDKGQSWEAPSYTKMDLHAFYTLPIRPAGVGIKVFAHIFNAFDTIYIQDAVDNSSYNAYSANGKNHLADDAEVYLGIPRTFNAGLQISL